MSLGIHRRPLWRGPIALLTVLLVALAAGLTIAATTGGHSAPSPPPAPARVIGQPAPGPLADAPHVLPPAAAGAARAFLLGYLAYVTGKATADEIPDASRKVIAGLGVQRLPASAAARKVSPAVLGLGAREASGSILHVTAFVSDGVSRYPVRILMVHEPGGWTTTELGSAE
jgi:hypothetical protein